MAHYRTAAESLDAGITYHLVPAPVWAAHAGGATYTPEAYEGDGFIHCTNGIDEIVTVANMFYRDDARPFQVLALDMSRIDADVRYDAPGEVYPHIYGALNTDAVVAVYPVDRDASGTFLDVTAPEAP